MAVIHLNSDLACFVQKPQNFFQILLQKVRTKSSHPDFLESKVYKIPLNH